MGRTDPQNAVMFTEPAFRPQSHDYAKKTGWVIIGGEEETVPKTV